jgi:hypothetical protein
MPVVDGKHYPYTSKGRKAAKRAQRRKATAKPKYSKGHKQKTIRSY